MQQTASESEMFWWSSTVYNSIARVCVPLFVMLTGFLLLQPQKVNEPIRVFLKKRLLRIGIAFAFWSAVYFAWRIFVYNETLSAGSIIQGILTGPYYHFWFIYLIAGLYIATPILRLVVGYGDRRILRYFLVVWFLCVAVVPLFQLATGFTVDGYLLVIMGWIGYFVLGVYLPQLKLKSWLLAGLLLLGVAWTIAGTWVMAFPFHSAGQYYFFLDSLTINVILASAALFLLLCRFPPDWSGKSHPKLGRLVKAVSVNTLPIYLFQLIILESLEKGFFGFRLSLWVLNPIIEIPLATVVTFFITLGLVLVMKRVPVLKKLIG